MGKLFLKRQNFDETITIKEGLLYSCGRTKKSKIVCCGAAVSRNHCTFNLNSVNGLTVIDLDSSNGVYVNGNRIGSKVEHLLHNNDTIGIGCFNMESTSENDFIYIVQRHPDDPPKLSRKRNSQNISISVPAKISRPNNNRDIIVIDDDDRVKTEVLVSSSTDASPGVLTNYNDKQEIIDRMNVEEKKPSLIPHTIEKRSSNYTINHPSKIQRERAATSTSANSSKSEDEDLREILNKKKKIKEQSAAATTSAGKNDLSFGNISSIEPETSSSFRLEEDIYCPSKSDLNSIENETSLKQDPRSRYSQIDIDAINLDEFVEEEEEDCFPISQLFEDPLDIKVQPEGVDNELLEEFSAESEKDLFHSQDDDCEIISSDDDNDDNNPWYARLYRSQVENESQIKHEVPVVAGIDEVENIIDSNNDLFDALGSVLDEDEMNVEQREIEKSPSPVPKKKSSPDEEKKKSTKSSSKKDDERRGSRKSSKEREKNRKSESKSKSTESRSKKSPEADETRSSDQDSIDFDKRKDSSRKISADVSSASVRLSIGTKLSTSKSKETRKILQIEAPHLPRNKRHSVSCAATTTSTSTASERKTLSTKDFYPDANKSLNDGKSLPTLKLTTKEKKELAEKKKIEEHRSLREKKLARMKNKWAKDSLPIGKGTPSPLTKEEKKQINQDRREKLRELAEKKKSSDKNLPEKRIVKPKIKTSTKSRNDLLAVDVNNSKKKKVEDTEKSKKPITLEEKNKSKHSEKSIPMIESSSNNNNKKLSKTDTEKENIKNPESLNLKEPLIKLIDCRKELDLKKEKENKSPNEKKIEKNNIKLKKRVTFNDALTTTRVYLIEPGMSLKKCVAKDATLPPIQNIKPPPSPKREEFLLRIFNWNPLWLSEQKTLAFPPPIIQDDPRPLSTKYTSYENYYETMEPLLALEVWSGVSREFDTLDPQMKRPILKTSIVTGSVSRPPIIENSNLCVTTFMFEAVVSKDNAMKQAYPVLGDLVMCEMAMNKNGKLIFHNIFVYVDSVHCTVIAPFTRYNKDLDKYVENPHTLLTYNMVTKSLETDNIAMYRLSRIKAVCYLRSNMRMIQALQYLPASPLIKQILDPTHEDYQLPIVQNYEQYPLVTKDSLNNKQLEAVVRITETVVQRLPRICMIQGPPGTGKSKVIVNIITEILYGNNRYKNGKGPMRILVCAPSNAAIDEVVLRLLDIRKNIQNNEKFKLVRTGRHETMHDSVKPISLTELARRDVASTTKVGTNQSLESIEAEKSHLEARINALKMELDTHKQKKVDNNFHQQTIKAKYDAAILKYELLTNKKTPDNIDQRHIGKLLRASEATLLSGADIIACTLSSCYTNQMEALFSGKDQIVSVCIVDEATQSTEAETLIPLMLGVKTMVLVGDPNQLPATVLSTQAKKLGLDKSLFSRLHGRFEQKANNPIIFLDTQYRMSLPISYWPNRFFYNGALKNDADRFSLPFQHYRVLNLESIQGTDKYANSDEAIFVTNLVYTIITCNKLENITGQLKIGIITPYNNQKNVIIGKLRNKMMQVPEGVREKIRWEVNTVDSFQGQERDIIIMSCVRSNGIGFLSDRQRLCVALTRAKHSLFICGNFKTFERDQMWNALLNDAKSRSVYTNVTFKATSNEIRKHIMK